MGDGFTNIYRVFLGSFHFLPPSQCKNLPLIHGPVLFVLPLLSQMFPMYIFKQPPSPTPLYDGKSSCTLKKNWRKYYNVRSSRKVMQSGGRPPSLRLNHPLIDEQGLLQHSLSVKRGFYSQCRQTILQMIHPLMIKTPNNLQFLFILLQKVTIKRDIVYKYRYIFAKR